MMYRAKRPVYFYRLHVWQAVKILTNYKGKRYGGKEVAPNVSPHGI